MSLASPPSASAATAEFRPQPPRETNPHLDSVGLNQAESLSVVKTQSYPASSVHKTSTPHFTSSSPEGDSTSKVSRVPQRGKPTGVSTPQPSNKVTYKSKRVFKVIIIGDAGVGKTCLSFRFCNGRFPAQTEATIGVDFRERNLIIDEELIRVQLGINSTHLHVQWDTAGQERYRQSIVAHYYRNVNAVVFVYDSTNPASFKSLAHWIAECRKHSLTSSDDTPHILVGNKCDLASSSIKVFADENDMPLFETSALADSEADHVESIFMTLVHKLRHSKAMHVQSADERSTKEQKLLLKAGDVVAGEESQSGWCC